MAMQRYESAKKRTKYEQPVAEQPRSASSFVNQEELEEKSFEIVSSVIAVPEVNETMEIDYLRAERNCLLTKLSCVEQQVGNL